MAKGAASLDNHPPYFEMISEAISTLKERTGSSQPAIAKFIEDKYKNVLPPNFKKILSVQLKKFVKSERLVKIKNSFKISSTEKVKLAVKETQRRRAVPRLQRSKLADFPNAKKFKSQGIEPSLQDKFSSMFSTIIATGSAAWAPSSGALPGEGVNQVEGCGDLEDDDINMSLEDITVGIQATQENETQGKRQRISANVEKSKGGTKKGGKVGGAAKLSQQIDPLVGAVESCNITTTPQGPILDVPGYSIASVMRVMKKISEISPGSELWLFATRLFMNSDKREMFTVLDENMRVIWLTNELAKDVNN